MRGFRFGCGGLGFRGYAFPSSPTVTDGEVISPVLVSTTSVTVVSSVDLVLVVIVAVVAAGSGVAFATRPRSRWTVALSTPIAAPIALVDIPSLLRSATTSARCSRGSWIVGSGGIRNIRSADLLRLPALRRYLPLGLPFVHEISELAFSLQLDCQTFERFATVC